MVTLFISGVRSKTVPVKVWDAILYEITGVKRLRVECPGSRVGRPEGERS